MADTEREDTAIDVWCDVVGRIGDCRVAVVEKPDRDSPGHGGCDAIVERCGVRQAVEHTSIDAYLNRRQDDARFRAVLAPLAEDVRRRFPDSWVDVIVPAHAIREGQDWLVLQGRVLAALIPAIEAMAITPFTGEPDFISHTLPGVPFDVWISRQGLDGDEATCVFGRDAPSDRRAQLVAGMTLALEAKVRQLAPYRSGGMPTVLLLDFDDVQLLNHDIVAASFVQAANVSGVDAADEVYLVDRRRRRRVWILPVKLSDRMHPDLPEFEAYHHAQYNWTWGTGR